MRAAILQIYVGAEGRLSHFLHGWWRWCVCVCVCVPKSFRQMCVKDAASVGVIPPAARFFRLTSCPFLGLNAFRVHMRAFSAQDPGNVHVGFHARRPRA